MSSSKHNDNKKKILILSVGQTKQFDDTTLSAENQY